MEYKKIIFKNKAIKKIKKGINEIAKAIKKTLGPNGKNIIIEIKNSSPLITKDGVTVAKNISFKDKIKNIGAQIIKEISSKTNDIVGDGTTTATVIIEKIINKSFKYISSGINIHDFIKGIDFAIINILLELKKLSIKCDNYNMIKNISTISSNSDKKIGILIADAIHKTGINGIITIEESNNFKDELYIAEGIQFEKGYLSPYFINNIKNDTVEYNDTYILISNKKINNIKEILHILEEIANKNQSLLIIAEEFDEEVINTLVINNIKKIIKVVAVQTPYFGYDKQDILNDISIMTNGIIISDEIDNQFQNIKIQDLGKAKKIIINKDNTTIICKNENNKILQELIIKIKNKIRTNITEYEKIKLKERLARLSNGIGIIKVGAMTETEMKEKKYRIEDALNSARSAIEKGVVSGGGIALLRLSKKLEKLTGNNFDQNLGIKLILNAIKSPFKQILKNSNKNYKIILNKIMFVKNDNFGYDALKHKYGNMIKMGIIDPVKVLETILKLSNSIINLILNTECVIIEKNKKKI